MIAHVVDFEETRETAVPTSRLAAVQNPQNVKVERHDWVLFRTVEGLQQKAGVGKTDLRRLVLKELADNGLDLGCTVQVGPLGDGYFIQDDGPGIDPEEVARLFSINRPMISSKVVRLPTRGALGNGLRVVAGAVLASDGSLVVTTRDRRLVLRPEMDGSTTLVGSTDVDFPVGVRIEISFGHALPSGSSALSWAQQACRLAEHGDTYSGKSSPHWYDAAQFHELLHAHGPTPVRELISRLDGCAGAKAGKIVSLAELERATCEKVSREEAVTLLTAARTARPVNPRRLGAIGPEAFPNHTYACEVGTATLGSAGPLAEIPFVVEAWVISLLAGSKTRIGAYVNRTPVTGALSVSRDKRDIDVFGCGLGHTIATAPKDACCGIMINVTTPFMPITSDGKAPDLKPFIAGIRDATGKAVRRARCKTRPDKKVSQKDVVLTNLAEAIAAVSGDGAFRFNERQLFYALRPLVLGETNKELMISHFKAIITDHEGEHGEITGMYREARGSLYQPHSDGAIALGTLMVEEYERPAWTFNKLLYIEKEGFSEALKEVKWPERHDCAVMSSKGFATRAAKDLVDKLADRDEPIIVFCVHDADASGTLIHQTFQDATKARGARKVQIVNLGLEPWEAIEIGLELEQLPAGDQSKPVADYVRKRSGSWETWLQTQRVELNAMTTPAFIEWLDAKMAEYGGGKLIPPAEIIEKEFKETLEQKVRSIITGRVLRDASIDVQVSAALHAMETPSPGELANGIRSLFEREPESAWRAHIEAVANDNAELSRVA